MTPEGRVLKEIITSLERRRKNGEPVWWVKLHGSPVQKAGLPDLHITYHGRSVWVEVKRPGGCATELQKHRLEEIKRAGGIVDVVTSVEGLDYVLAEAMP